MASKGGLPDAIERRAIVYGKPKKPVNYDDLGRNYLEAGRATDALDCADRMTDEGQRKALVEAVKQRALKLGDWFILRRVNGYSPVSEAEWKEAAQVAEREGKTRFRIKIARELKDEETAERLEREIGLRPPLTDPDEAAKRQVEALAAQAIAEAAVKADDAKADQAKADQAKADQAKADQAKADEAKADEAKADEAKTDEAKTDEAKADDAKTDDAQADEAKTDDAKADDAKAD